MSQTELVSYSPRRTDTRPYRTRSLIGLLVLIAYEDDPQASEEFHSHRPVFRWSDRRQMLLVEFVDALRRSASAQRFTNCHDEELDYAYDLTIDKYTRLGNGCPASPKAKGPDCRLYFQAVVERVHAWEARHPDADALQIETVTAQTLQRLVVRQFHLACLEARRAMYATRSRYAWQLPGGAIYVWLPVWLRGWRRRKWLEANVDNPDPSRSDEKQRVQAIVDQHLGVSRQVTLGANVDQVPGDAQSEQTLSWLVEHEVTVRGLAQVVADEKAHTLECQRPAIRALGKPTLRRLVHRIFEDLSRESYRDGDVAEAFGLSKATLSRFSGSRWRQHAENSIPDLWVNTAQVLAHHGVFVEAARQTGVWPKIQHTLQASGEETSP